MAEINDGNGIKVIAFYLPQFHEIPENNKFYGKGFTEWTNVKKAVPLYEGHYQPKVPLNNKYYCLLDDDVKIWQSELAQEHKVWGFCYYHYWFKNGKKLLEKPLEQMLGNAKITIPFCLCWANENWSKRWDGGNNEVIVEQDYGDIRDWEQHFNYLVQFFKDDRYITLDGKPVLIIYKPDEIPHVNEMLQFWNEQAVKNGFPGICYMIQFGAWFFSPSYDMTGFSYQIKFQPFFANDLKGTSLEKLEKRRSIYQLAKRMHLAWILEIYRNIRRRIKAGKKSESSELTKWNYDELWEMIIESEEKPELIEGAFPDWDNTARKRNGISVIGASPEKFEKNMKLLCKKVKNSGQKPVIFINAWNEWGEGAYLEPDEKHNDLYLKAIKKALEEDGLES